MHTRFIELAGEINTGMPAWVVAKTADALNDHGKPLKGLDLTVEMITHRFTPKSKDVLLGWYPRTKLEMDEEQRSEKRSKFGGVKYVFPKETMTELRSWFAAGLEELLPQARQLYWT